LVLSIGHECYLLMDTPPHVFFAPVPLLDGERAQQERSSIQHFQIASSNFCSGPLQQEETVPTPHPACTTQ
jgi:hypothetical protein